MEELLSKLSSYNLLNNLFLGVVFNFILSKIINIDIFDGVSLLEKLILCYFVGMLIGRFASLVVENVAQYMKVVKYAPYVDYVSASKIDPEIKVLSEVNNMYKNMVSTFVLLLLAVALNFLFSNNAKIVLDSIRLHLTNNLYLYLTLVLTAFFLSSYRKQTRYVTKRIAKALGKPDVNGGE